MLIRSTLKSIKLVTSSTTLFQSTTTKIITKLSEHGDKSLTLKLPTREEASTITKFWNLSAVMIPKEDRKLLVTEDIS